MFNGLWPLASEPLACSLWPLPLAVVASGLASAGCAKRKQFLTFLYLTTTYQVAVLTDTVPPFIASDADHDLVELKPGNGCNC